MAIILYVLNCGCVLFFYKGCTGALAHELTWTYPEMKVKVFDLPDVIKNVTQFQPEKSDSSRIIFISGNFFEHITTGSKYVQL